MKLKIKRYNIKDYPGSFGYFNEKEKAIYIRDDMKNIDYIETLMHEYIHYITYCLVPNNRKLRYKLYLIYDVIDSIIFGWNISAAKQYIKEYNYVR